MKQAEREHIDVPRRPRAPDRGTTFVELLVAIVLIGTAVVAILAALRTTIIGTVVERDHARAQQWLQAAVGAVGEADYVPCDDPGTFANAQLHMRNDYSGAIADTTEPPPGWSDSQLVIVAPIKVWDGNTYWDPADTSDPDDCFQAEGFSLQLITIQVTDPDGKLLESVQVVKSDPSN